MEQVERFIVTNRGNYIRKGPHKNKLVVTVDNTENRVHSKDANIGDIDMENDNLEAVERSDGESSL